MAGKAFTAARDTATPGTQASRNSIIVTVAAESGLSAVSAGEARLIFEDTITAIEATELMAALTKAVLRRVNSIGADAFSNIANGTSRE